MPRKTKIIEKDESEKNQKETIFEQSIQTYCSHNNKIEMKGASENPSKE
ncbi:hypothetical protein [Flavobacterium eburneipallidum]|nr:hypothetical protein [Flavobacterium eburneipallidum]